MTDADQILYLDHGRITGAGTHHQLLATTPGYAQWVSTVATWASRAMKTLAVRWWCRWCQRSRTVAQSAGGWCGSQSCTVRLNRTDLVHGDQGGGTDQ